ncbi:MAG TPA: hypothetical protein V6D04_08855 [Candidatus Obscuribacterales bacterium]
MTELLSRVIAELEKLPDDQQDAIATRLLSELRIEKSDTWIEQDQSDLSGFSLSYAATLFPEDQEIVDTSSSPSEF